MKISTQWSESGQGFQNLRGKEQKNHDEIKATKPSEDGTALPLSYRSCDLTGFEPATRGVTLAFVIGTKKSTTKMA
jgi:hypothetical protein